MTKREAWFEIFKSVIASGRDTPYPGRVANHFLEVYESRWKVRPEITIAWENSRPLNQQELRSEAKQLSPGKYLLVLIPRRRRPEIEVMLSFVGRSANWQILVDDNVVGASERALFAFTSEEKE